MNIKTLQCLVIAIPIAVAGALSGCGGGGSSNTGVPVTTPPEPEPTPSPSEPISWSDLNEGATIEPGTYMVSGVPEEASDQFENGTYDLDAGESIEIGDLNLICAEGGEGCTFVVMDTTVMSSGGNIMTSSVTPLEPPVNAETERLNAALQRAQAAENAAWSSAAQASLQCQAVPAACQAAQDATTAALLAEGANERAQNAMTAAEAERAADVAEQGANRAATAAADAVRLADAGQGQQPEPPTTVDPVNWLLSGTVESAAARDQAVSKIAAIQATNPEDHLPGVSVGVYPFRLRDPAVFPDYTNHWGYWNHPSLSGVTTKVQRIVYDVEYDNSRRLVERTVLGLMDHGYFGVTHRPSLGGIGSAGVFYETDHAVESSLPLKSLNLLGATWTGDALATKKTFVDAADSPFFGTATLEITGENSLRGVSYEYLVDFDVTLNNGYTLQINGGQASNNATEIHRFSYLFHGAEFRDATSQEPQGFVRFSGVFAGPQAQEVIGRFETPTYEGAFGGKRDNE